MAVVCSVALLLRLLWVALAALAVELLEAPGLAAAPCLMAAACSVALLLWLAWVVLAAPRREGAACERSE